MSLFRSIPVTTTANNKWEDLIQELQSKAPLLLPVLRSLQLFLPTITVTLTKLGQFTVPEFVPLLQSYWNLRRSWEMCGLQSVISALMCSGHRGKQVNMVSSSSIYILLSHKVTSGIQSAKPPKHVPQLSWHPEANGQSQWDSNCSSQEVDWTEYCLQVLGWECGQAASGVWPSFRQQWIDGPHVQHFGWS